MEPNFIKKKKKKKKKKKMANFRFLKIPRTGVAIFPNMELTPKDLNSDCESQN